MAFHMNPNLTRALLRSPRVHSAVSKYVRYKSGCEKGQGEEKCKKMTKFPCGKPDIMSKPEKKSKTYKQTSMWLNPFCEPDDPHCPFNPRFDDIYYVESDKAKRKYWQTWVACPPIQIKPKKICCFANAKRAPAKRRKPSAKPVTACEQKCPEKSYADCPRLARRCHRDGRSPPSCKPDRGPANCVKPLTPYPSFSECKHPKIRPLPNVECLCLKTPMMCEVWEQYRLDAIRKSKK
ncbi:uncharacterized protein LOC110186163 [Drosophila serrata]|uniref:uncharacterized protein LOC110186163 n=1 Tax=Drosophila serrata TaxID=7274 RepID=UPI000A1D372B|nr:uncharacterized protein LOC110186163 [Drosophila serrata]KAH8385921.1 hypothetical protein KR200_006763 [Drosophila serrata]